MSNKNWHFIIMNPNITYKFVEKHTNEFVSKYYLSKSSNLTIDDMENMEDKLSMYIDFRENPFTKLHEDEKMRLYRQQHLKYTHQLLAEFRTVIYHPSNLEFMVEVGLVDISRFG